MQSISSVPFLELSKQIKVEVPHLSHQVWIIYMKYCEGKIEGNTAISDTIKAFKPDIFKFHPLTKKAYHQFFLSLLPQPFDSELDFDKALNHLREGFRNRDSELVRYCSNWLIFFLVYDMKDHKGEPTYINTHYFRDIFEYVVKSVRENPVEITEEMVFEVLETALSCGCRIPEFGFRQPSQPSLDRAAIGWLIKKCVPKVKTIQRYLDWAVEHECDFLATVSVSIFYEYHRSQREIKQMWNYGHKIPLLQLACKYLASSCVSDIDSLFGDCPELCEGAKLFQELPEKRCRINTLDYIWEIFPESVESVKLGNSRMRVISDRSTPSGVITEIIQMNLPHIRDLEIRKSFKGVAAAMKPLEKNNFIENLQIDDKLLYDENTERTLLSISRSRSIKRITLDLGDHPTTVLFCLLMQKSTHFQFMRLYVPAKKKSITEVFKLLETHSSVRFVDLKLRTSIAVDVEALENLLINNTVMQVLKIHDCDFSREQKLKILQALEQNSTMQSLEGLRTVEDDDELKEVMSYHQRII